MLGLCAAFLPYYSEDDSSFLQVIDTIAAGRQRQKQHEHFSAVDFAVGCAVDALSNDVRSDAATVQYLRRLASLKDHVKKNHLRLPTRIRLQGVLYSFAQPGGPRYASKAVNRLAFRALDELFPHGKRTRRAINFGFRSLFVFSKLTGGVYYACVFLVEIGGATGNHDDDFCSIPGVHAPYQSPHLPTHLSPYLPTCPPTYPSTCLPTHPPAYLPTHLPTYPPLQHTHTRYVRAWLFFFTMFRAVVNAFRRVHVAARRRIVSRRR